MIENYIVDNIMCLAEIINAILIIILLLNNLLSMLK